MIATDRSGDLLAKHLAESPVARFAITTLPDLGSLIGGLREGETSVIASFPKHGKTALVEQIALDLSLEHDVLFLPLEMGADATRLRLASKLSGKPVAWIEQHGIEAETLALLNQRRLAIRAPQADRKWNLGQIARGIERNRAPIVIIDHLRWIDGWLEGGMAPTRLAEQIRIMAHSLGVHVIQCAQLKIEDLGKKPIQWRLQDSNAIQQLASVEILINRPYHGQGAKDRIAELVVRSNRWGPTGRVHTRWIGPTQTFWHISETEFETQFECSCKGPTRRGTATK